MLLKKTAPTFGIVWSEEDGEFMATCSAFPGLSALDRRKKTL